jgi:hypothetical protein
VLALDTLEELRVRRVGVAVLAAEALEELRVRRVGVLAPTSFVALEELRVLLVDERVAEATDPDEEATDCSSSDL